tara:strand:- start:934 stop:1143 length:210 start_codon:yes stop_codon:yes gene_type:complete
MTTSTADSDNSISLGKLAQAIAAVLIGGAIAWVGNQTVALGKDVEVLKTQILRIQMDINDLKPNRRGST